MKRSVEEYEALARGAESYIKAEVAKGREYVSYWEVGQHLGVDRFTLAWALGHLVRLNTEEGVPLWSSFVGYKYDVYDKDGWLKFRAGEPGDSFIECAREHGQGGPTKKAFVDFMRRGCRNTLALESLAAMQSALRRSTL
jgi:hypothetical protein